MKNALWGDVHVTTDSVPKCMSSLRARLEPDACIQTVYKRGYRFTATIRREGAAAAGTPVRLAIMPFATGHSVPEHIGLALAEETTACLSGVGCFAVAVLARDSVFNLAQRGLTALQIGRELKADLVLTGTLQAFSSHYRLRAEMIRIEDGTQIWVEDLLTPQSRTSALQSELMQRLAYRFGAGGPGDSSSSPGWGAELPGDTALQPEQKMSGVNIAAAADSKNEDESHLRQAEAYEMFLSGHHEWQTLHRHRMQDGMQRLLRAIELDPELIPAKVDLAHLCVAQALFGFMPPDAAAEVVHRMADSIPDLPFQAEALLPALGWVNFHFDRNLPAALLAFSYSAHLPHDLWTTRARSMFSVSRHRFAEAIELLGAAIRVDPFSPWLHSRLAWALHLDGQASESMELARKMVAQFPDSEGTCLYGSVILAFNGEAKLAAELAQRLAQSSPHFDPASTAHAYALACAGRADEARAVLERLQWLSRERYVVRLFTPAAYVALGDHDAALDELRAANEARCPWFFQMMANPCIKPLHGNPEFERLRAILPAMEAEVEQDLEMED
jgi:TolB-like protein/tetratricopeptide (TPR) repeat protein